MPRSLMKIYVLASCLAENVHLIVSLCNAPNRAV
jgi:hypothetical protein